MTDQTLPKQARPKRKRRSTLRFIPLFAIGIFSLISFVATAMGMHGLLVSLGKMSEYLSFGIAGAFTLALQLFLVWAVRLVKISPGIHRKGWWLGVYVICLFVSVGFAYAFWFHAIAADGYSRETYSVQTRGILYQLQRFGQEYDRIAFSLTDLESYSRATAEEEIAYGGTCGDNSPPTRGPRARLRERDARYFATIAPHFASQREGIQERIAELETSLVGFQTEDLESYQRVANRALIQARGLENDAQLRSLRTWLEQRISQGESQFSSAGGEIFTCPDPYLEEQAGLILAIDLPPVPDDFVWFDSRERQESVQLAFSRLLNILGVEVGSEAAFVPKSVDELWSEAKSTMAGVSASRPIIQDVLPLVFGLVTDLLIFLAAMAAPWKEDPFKESLDSLAKAQSERPTLGRDFFYRIEAFLDSDQIPDSYRLLQRHAVTHAGRDFIFVSEPALTDEDSKLRTMMEFLVSAGVAEIWRPILSRDKAPKELLELLEENQTLGTRTRLYRLKPGFLQELAGELFASQIFMPQAVGRTDPSVGEEERSRG